MKKFARFQYAAGVASLLMMAATNAMAANAAWCGQLAFTGNNINMCETPAAISETLQMMDIGPTGSYGATGILSVYNRCVGQEQYRTIVEQVHPICQEAQRCVLSEAPSYSEACLVKVSECELTYHSFGSTQPIQSRIPTAIIMEHVQQLQTQLAHCSVPVPPGQVGGVVGEVPSPPPPSQPPARVGGVVGEVPSPPPTSQLPSQTPTQVGGVIGEVPSPPPPSQTPAQVGGVVGEVPSPPPPSGR